MTNFELINMFFNVLMTLGITAAGFVMNGIRSDIKDLRTDLMAHINNNDMHNVGR